MHIERYEITKMDNLDANDVFDLQLAFSFIFDTLKPIYRSI